MVRTSSLGVVSRVLLASAAVLVAAGQAQADVLVNGGFETGTFDGWTLSGDTHGSAVLGNMLHNAYVSQGGAYHVESDTTFFAPISSTHIPFSLQQTIQTHIGDQYRLSLWADGLDQAEVGAQVRAAWNGALLIDTGNYFSTKNVWTEYSYDLVATTSTSVLKIDLINGQGETGLDSVSVLDLTPQPPAPPPPPVPPPPPPLPITMLPPPMPPMDPVAVPEPASAGLMALGLATLLLRRRMHGAERRISPFG